jgi:PKD repeat protein
MGKVKLLFVAIVISTFSLNTYSQVDLSEPDRINCGTAAINNQRLAQNPFIQSIIEEQNKLAKEYEKNHVINKSGVISYTIPVVYHIIHNNGPENVSNATIEASIANLNEDFQKLNTDISQVVSSFTGIAADIEIQFRLAHIDPNGNCTEGITRTVSTETYAMTENAKSLVNWNTTKYLNIWVGQTMASGSGGWSYYPGWAPSQNQEGIVIRSAQLGNSITHEVGHFLNLPHTWGSSNTPGQASNCSLDDGVSDTPNTIGNSGTCNTSSITCSSLDNVQNYMDYATCTRMFTEGQKSRMHAALNSAFGARNNLWTSANLIATGTNDPYGPVICKPVAEFSYDKKYICEGASVTFTDHSWGSDATVWNWTFTGGSPTTSSNQNPTITYPLAGIYGVTLVASNTAPGNDIETKNNIITVSSLTADYIGPMVDGFENTTTFSNDWRIESNEGQVWNNNNAAAATGSRSVRILNYFISSTGEVDQLISPSYNISALTLPGMKFKVAYAQTVSTDADKLMVYYSTNCGESWVLKLPMVGAALASVPIQTNMFTPSGAGDWIEKTVDLSAIASSTNVRFKFEFVSGGGNNLYLDDINITGAVGVDEFSNIGSFNVFPNPTNSSAQISFNLIKDVENLSITIRNAVGQEVTNVIKGQSFSSGKYTLNIDEQRKLSSGIYFVEFNADNVVRVQKLIVQ